MFRRAATWLAICTAITAGFEGLYTHAYHDSVGVVTICYGVTNADRPVHMGDTATREECVRYLAKDLQRYNAQVSKCIHVPLRPEQRAAIVSMAYNVGVHGVCHSNFLKHVNDNDPRAGHYMLSWDKAGGRVLRGLTRRREAECRLYESKEDRLNEGERRSICRKGY